MLERKRVCPELGLIIHNAVAGSDAVDEDVAVSGVYISHLG